MRESNRLCDEQMKIKQAIGLAEHVFGGDVAKKHRSHRMQTDCTCRRGPVGFCELTYFAVQILRWVSEVSDADGSPNV